jgi:hypothetical protein
MLHLYHPSHFRRFYFGAISTKHTNTKLALNALYEPFQRIFQEVTKRKLSMTIGCTASVPKVMLYAAASSKTVQKVML